MLHKLCTHSLFLLIFVVHICARKDCTMVMRKKWIVLYNTAGICGNENINKQEVRDIDLELISEHKKSYNFIIKVLLYLKKIKIKNTE